MKNQAISEKILGLQEDDFNLRQQLIEERRLSVTYDKEMERIHIRNAECLDEIIQAIGYPTVEKVGVKASEAAWIIIQHAISKPAFMKKCRDLLKIEAAKDSAEAVQLARLSDRILVLEGKLQLYGTQFDWDEQGALSPNAYDDKEKVNQRRRSIGLCELEEEVLRMRENAAKDNIKPPEDLQKKKTEYEQWRKEVGWIH